MSLITTGPIAGTLLAHGVRHPWLERTTEVLLARAEAREDLGPYDTRGLLEFLQHAPDPDRARALAVDVTTRAVDRGVITLDPNAAGEVHGVLDVAPLPGSLARAAFDDATVQAHLDRLVAGQREDGGWTFNWPAWSTAAIFVADFTTALQLDPHNVLTYNNLAWLWATCPEVDVCDGQRAVEYATRAGALTAWAQEDILDTLAAAYAAHGQFDRALKWIDKALLLAPEDLQPALRARRALYQAGKPYRLE